jgi:hypothetical protein
VRPGQYDGARPRGGRGCLHKIIFETFHEGWDYRDRLDAVLKHFRKH